LNGGVNLDLFVTRQQLVVGFSQIGAESSWRLAETKSIQQEAEKRGVQLKLSDAQQKQENQIKAVLSESQMKIFTQH